MTRAAARPDRSWALTLALLSVIVGFGLIGIGVVLGQMIERDGRSPCRWDEQP